MMLSVCMFFFCMGDAVSQAAQTFLPAVIGRPAAARSLGKQLMTTGVVVGVVNCAAAGDASSSSTAHVRHITILDRLVKAHKLSCALIPAALLLELFSRF